MTPASPDRPKGDSLTTGLSRLVGAMLSAVGLVHLLPAVGVLGAERLSALYGIGFDEPNLALLMRHRAVLFGLLGALLLAAAVRPHLRPLAFVAGFGSVGSFLLLAGASEVYTDPVARVIAVDVGALACLIVGAAAHAVQRRRSGSAA